MENGKKALGKAGEDAACMYLTAHGHSVIDRNWRSSRFEIDIVTIDRDGLHFVEVKSRKAPLAAMPEDNVGPAKRRSMIAGAGRYLAAKRRLIGDMEVFFDVVSVIFEDNHTHITHYPKAFIPIYE